MDIPAQTFENFGIYRPVDGHANEVIRAVAYAALPEMQACITNAGLRGELIVLGALGGTFMQSSSLRRFHEHLEINGFNPAEFEARLRYDVRPRETRLLAPLDHTAWKRDGSHGRAITLQIDPFSEASKMLDRQAEDIEHAFLASGGWTAVRIHRMKHVSVMRYIPPFNMVPSWEKIPLRVRRETADIFACRLAAAGIGDVLLTPMVLGREKIDFS